MKSKMLLEQFRQEAPGSPYLTGGYLRQLCKRQRRYIPIPKVPLPKIPGLTGDHQRETLLECDGWKIQYIETSHWVVILNPKGLCRAIGKRKQLLAPILGHIHAQARLAELGPQESYGIVLCGGGAKGAFQLGVWKRLEELGVLDQITGVAGASVGALNALLFAQGDYQKAESLWLSFQDGDLVQPNEKLLGNLASSIGNGVLKLCLGGAFPAKELLDVLTDWRENWGAFSTEKLEGIVRENISVEALRRRPTYVSLAAAIVPRLHKLGKTSAFFQSEYAYLDPLCSEPVEMNVRKVLASAALPGAFTPKGVDGKICIDGGALDNAPAFPLIRAGYQRILVIHLSRRKKEKKEKKDKQASFEKKLRKKLTDEELAGVTFCHIWPEEKLGDILKIDPDRTRWRIQAGYEAACAQLDSGFFRS